MKVSFILRIRIRRDVKRKQLAIDQSNYIKKILCDFGIEDCHLVSTPIDDYHTLTPSGPSEPWTNIVEYQAHIGSVMYVMVGIRPDIAFAFC